MRPEEKRRFLAGILLGLLLSRAIRALLSTLYFQSLVTLRLNTSALWMLVLLAPALAPFLARGHRALLLAGGLGSAALPLARFTPWYVPAGALAAGALLAALPLLGVGAAGALVGVALDAAILVLGHGHDPTLNLAGAGAALAAGVALALLAPTPARGGAGGLLAGAALGLVLVLEWAFLASPHAAARWAGLPVWLAGAASLFGLVVGATRLAAAGRWLLLAGGIGLLDVVLLRSPLVALSLALLQALVGACVARAAPALSASRGGLGLALALAPTAFVVLYFRAPLGISEWGGIVPFLALAAVLLAAPAPRPPRGARAAGGAASAAIVLAFLAAGAVPAPLDPPPEGDELTLASWNVRQAFGNRGALDPHLYASVLRDLDADVVVLQESDTARLSSGGLDIVSYLADDLGMRAAYGRSGVAVLSRLPLADVEPHEATREREWFFEAALDAGEGRILWIHGVHLGRSAPIRLAQADEILAAAEARPGPRVVAGDMNACPAPTCFGGRPSDGTYERLTSRYQDAWVLAGHEPTDPAGNTHHASNPSRRIDMVLVEGLEVLEMGPVRDERARLGSDHLPNHARLRLPAP